MISSLLQRHREQIQEHGLRVVVILSLSQEALGAAPQLAPTLGEALNSPEPSAPGSVASAISLQPDRPTHVPSQSIIVDHFSSPTGGPDEDGSAEDPPKSSVAPVSAGSADATEADESGVGSVPAISDQEPAAAAAAATEAQLPTSSGSEASVAVAAAKTPEQPSRDAEALRETIPEEILEAVTRLSKRLGLDGTPKSLGDMFVLNEALLFPPPPPPHARSGPGGMTSTGSFEEQPAASVGQEEHPKLQPHLSPLRHVFWTQVQTFCTAQAKRIAAQKSKIQKSAAGRKRLLVRHHLKQAWWWHAAGDHGQALRHYQSCWRQLLELNYRSDSTFCVEVKTVAALLVFWICRLQLQMDYLDEAQSWFHQLLERFRNCPGPAELSFLHQGWLSDVYGRQTALLLQWRRGKVTTGSSRRSASGSLKSGFSAGMFLCSNPLKDITFIHLSHSVD